MTSPPDTPAPSVESVTVAERGEAAPLLDAAGCGPRVSGWFIFVYALTYFSFMLATLMPGLFSLAFKVQLLTPETKAASLGVVVGVGALVNIVAMPIVGLLSDRTRIRWGRRRPWLALGIGVGALGALVIALAPSVVVVIVGWSVSSLALACVAAAVNPVIAENIPEAQRGKVGAMSGISTQLAGVAAVLLGGLLTSNLLALFLLPFAVMVLAGVLFVLTVPDRPADPPTTVKGGGIAALFKDLAFNPIKHRDFSLVLLGKFLLQVGMTFFSTYQLYYLLDRLGFTPELAGQRLALVGGIGILVTTLFAIMSGILSDRLRRRKTFIYCAAALIAAGLVTLGFSENFLMYSAGAMLILAGAGTFGSVDMALVGDTIPDRENDASRWMGLYGVASNLPNAIAPVVAPLVLLIGSPEAKNYTLLYISAAAIALGAAMCTRFIKSVR